METKNITQQDAEALMNGVKAYVAQQIGQLTTALAVVAASLNDLNARLETVEHKSNPTS